MDDLTKLKLLTDETDGAQGAGGGAGSPPCCPATATGEKAPCGACASSEAEAAIGRRMFTDEQLTQLLELHGGDVYQTAYDVLLRKAESSAVRLSGGTELPDQRDYWLSRARSVRPNATRAVGRADRT